MNPIELDIIRVIETNPRITQRLLALECKVSLGKINLCINKLVASNVIKKVFLPSGNKCSYTLTKKGMKRKISLLRKNINECQREYSRLNILIQLLNKEVYESEKKL